MVDDVERAPGDEPERDEVRRVDVGHLRHRGVARPRVRPALRPDRGGRLVRLPAPELHDDVRLRHHVAPGVLRRRPVAQGAL